MGHSRREFLKSSGVIAGTLVRELAGVQGIRAQIGNVPPAERTIQTPRRTLNTKIVGKSAAKIAEMAGFSVPPDNPIAAADAVERLVGLTPQERVQMGRNGRHFLEENHNIPRLAERLLSALQRPTPATELARS